MDVTKLQAARLFFYIFIHREMLYNDNRRRQAELNSLIHNDKQEETQ